jgi:hypothetical protein
VGSFQLQTEPFAKLSGGRSPGNENRGSFFCKGVSGDWRRHLSGEAVARFRQQAGPWLDRFGYTLKSSSHRPAASMTRSGL